jgi:hypothetical protein
MIAPGAGAADALPFKWVRITNKQNLMGPLNQLVATGGTNGQQICWDGSTEIVSRRSFRPPRFRFRRQCNCREATY